MHTGFEQNKLPSLSLWKLLDLAQVGQAQPLGLQAPEGCFGELCLQGNLCVLWQNKAVNGLDWRVPGISSSLNPSVMARETLDLLGLAGKLPMTPNEVKL